MENPPSPQPPVRSSSISSSVSDASDRSSLAEELAQSQTQQAATDEKQPLLPQQPKDIKVDDNQTSPEGSSNPVSDVRYVLSGQPTGWAAMAETVRAYDEEKVKDTKEDIDTLLVFAGLFSAVLTAFVVESYQRLSPDTSSQMLLVMQQIALQTASYNMVNGMINATSQPPANITDAASQPFQPSHSDIAVNVLWFASLIFSLITASFGMLVKQWLREYLAVENPSPQARLRIRRFRHPELLQWNVFEIAAILPILQQIALALFFIGLCYFTESVHSSVGHTSLPLVAAWAFSFSTVTILPMFFPRCPYKTTLLKHLLQSIHMHSVNAIQKTVRVLSAWQQEADYASIRDYAFRWTLGLIMSLDDHVSKSDEQRAVVAERADLDILVDVDALQSNDELLGSTILESLHQIQPEWDNVVNFVLRVLEHRLQRHDLVSTEPGPLSLQTLSRAGRTAIIDILSHYSSSAISQYVQSDQAIARWSRSKETMAAFYIFFSPTRYPLPRTGVTVLNEVLQYKGIELIRLLAQKCPRPVDLSDDKFYLLVWGLCNTFEDLDTSLPSSLRYFETVMDMRFNGARHGQIDATFPDTSFTIQGDLEAWPWRQVMSQDARTNASRYMIWTVHRALRHMHRPAMTNPSQAVVRAKTAAAIALQPPPSRFVDALIGMWNMSYVARIENFSHTLELRFRAAVEECLAMKESTLALLKALGQMRTSMVIHMHTKWVAAPCGPWLLLEDAQQKLENFIDAVNDLSDTTSNGNIGPSTSSTSQITTVHVLLICYIALQMVELPDAVHFADQWKSLFKVLTRLGNQSMGTKSAPIRSTASLTADVRNASPSPYSSRPGPPSYTPQPPQISGVAFEESQELVEHCLDLVQKHDTHVFAGLSSDRYSQNMSPPELRAAYDEWSTMLFKDEDTVVEDEFVEMLARIYNPPGVNISRDGDDLRFFRLKKLGILGSTHGGSSHSVDDLGQQQDGSDDIAYITGAMTDAVDGDDDDGFFMDEDLKDENEEVESTSER